MRRVHVSARRRSRAAVVLAIVGLVTAVAMLVGGSSAFAAGTAPSVTKENDASQR